MWVYTKKFTTKKTKSEIVLIRVRIKFVAKTSIWRQMRLLFKKKKSFSNAFSFLPNRGKIVKNCSCKNFGLGA